MARRLARRAVRHRRRSASPTPSFPFYLSTSPTSSGRRRGRLRPRRPDLVLPRQPRAARRRGDQRPALRAPRHRRASTRPAGLERRDRRPGETTERAGRSTGTRARVPRSCPTPTPRGVTASGRCALACRRPRSRSRSRRSGGALAARVPRAARPRLLALPAPDLAGAAAGRLRAARALDRAAVQAAGAAALPPPRVRHPARHRPGDLADRARGAGRARGPRPRLPADHGAPPRAPTLRRDRGVLHVRGRGRELLSLPALRRAPWRASAPASTARPSCGSTSWSRTGSCARWPGSTCRRRRSERCALRAEPSDDERASAPSTSASSDGGAHRLGERHVARPRRAPSRWVTDDRLALSALDQRPARRRRRPASPGRPRARRATGVSTGTGIRRRRRSPSASAHASIIPP